MCVVVLGVQLYIISLCFVTYGVRLCVMKYELTGYVCSRLCVIKMCVVSWCVVTHVS